MKFFKNLFNPIFSNNSDNVKEIYNRAVNELAARNVHKAIDLFKTIDSVHMSAAYNLGLIYLDGDGTILPDYNLARKYLKQAKDMGHPKAEKSAFVIGLVQEEKIGITEYMEKYAYSISQYAIGNQAGNLAYIIANDIIFNIIETSSNKKYSLDRFIDYEVYCIRNYASNEVNHFYEQSSLKNYATYYDNDWEDGEVATVSAYLNEKVQPSIIMISKNFGKNLTMFDMGVLRLITVNHIYNYFYK